MVYLVKFFVRFMLTACLCISAAQATTIAYTATALGANQWRYDYTVTNDTLAVPLEEFTLFFDESLYGQLSSVGSPAGWDILVIQPDAGIPAAGFYDALAFGGAIAPSASAFGFVVTFEYFGIGVPGAQLFSILDPLSFIELDAGLTQGPAAIPLPGTAWLVLLGALALVAAPRAAKGKQFIARGGK